MLAGLANVGGLASPLTVVGEGGAEWRTLAGTGRRGRSKEEAASAPDSKRWPRDSGDSRQEWRRYPPLLEHSEELGQVRQTGFYPACTCSSRSSGKSLRFPRSKMRATSISQGCCRGRIGDWGLSVSTQPRLRWSLRSSTCVTVTAWSCLREDLGQSHHGS